MNVAEKRDQAVRTQNRAIEAIEREILIAALSPTTPALHVFRQLKIKHMAAVAALKELTDA